VGLFLEEFTLRELKAFVSSLPRERLDLKEIRCTQLTHAGMRQTHAKLTFRQAFQQAYFAGNVLLGDVVSPKI